MIQITPTTLLLLQLLLTMSNCGKVLTVCYDKSAEHRNRKQAKVIEVSLELNVNLTCNFCHEEDDYQAKNWYYRKRGNKFWRRELYSDLNYRKKGYKVYISPSHVLSLRNFKTNDSGVYACKNFTDNKDLFTYVLDGIYDVTYPPIVGTANDWHEFHRNIIIPINQNINESASMIFPFEVGFAWGGWGPCGRQDNQNVRNITGKCQIRPKRHQILKMVASDVTSLQNKLNTLLDDFNISCRSVEFNSLYPKMSQILRKVPDVTIQEPCSLRQSRIKLEKQSNRTENTSNYLDIKYVTENGHLILTCPEVLVESEIKWYKDNIPLNSSFRNNMAKSLEEPHLTIDNYNALYILHASKYQEGIYTCTANGNIIHKFQVKVVTKSKFLNQDFIRYSIYLGFVLSLTVTCYCAGICVAWQRRSSFADPFYLITKQHSNTFEDREPLLRN